METCWIKSPLGGIRVDAQNGMVRALALQVEEQCPDHVKDRADTPCLKQVQLQLHQYFRGAVQTFDLAIDFSNYSPFAVNVLRALQAVPYGTTVSYGDLALLCGHPGAARAVGRVVGANRTPLLIPCHRVIGSTGKLTGYSAAGGLETKRWLLDFEQQGKQPA